jgi:hypothetical protein
MSLTATCDYCAEEFEAEREYCPKCGKSLPRELKATLVIEQLEPDCSKCHGTCCRALAFDWPHYKKPAGERCKNLSEDNRCNIWSQLEQEGFTECRSYTCYGAGQSVAGLIEERHPDTWRTDPVIQNGEMNIFQKVYTELYTDIRKQKPPVGDIGKLKPE